MTSRQFATGLVLCYPYFPVFENFLSVVAESRGEPTVEQVAQSVLTNGMATEWQALDKYVVGICSDFTHEYVPMLPRPPSLSRAC